MGFDLSKAPKISEGGFVQFRKMVNSPESQEILDGWIQIYGRGPFQARCVTDGKYLALFDVEGKRLPLGAGEGLINASFVEPCSV